MSAKQPTSYLVGYARVSTADQKLDLQLDALRKAGVHEDNLHIEKVSGASTRRPKLDLAIKDLREGDTLLVWRIDRLARSVRELNARLDQIYKKGASFRSLRKPLISIRYLENSRSVFLVSSPSLNAKSLRSARLPESPLLKRVEAKATDGGGK